MRRILASVLVVAAALAGGIPVASGQQDWRAEVGRLLERRAEAVRTGDEAAFMATMRGAPQAFRADRRTWFRRIQALPIDRYALALAPHTYQDLSRALTSPLPGDEVRVVAVSERIGFAGYDEHPADETLYLKVVRRDGAWHVHADDDLEDLGLLSARNMWDFAPVQRVEREGVMVLYHTGAGTAEQLLASTRAAVDRIRRSWPLDWRPRVIVMVPRNARDLARIFATTVDLSPFVAFAGASVFRDERGSYALTGHRIFVQPDTFFTYSTAFQDDTLGHEMLHHATRHLAGAFTPSWLEEAVAQLFGERDHRTLTELARRAHSIERLPRGYEFFLPPRDRIHLSYQASLHVARYLRDRFEEEALAAFYQAVGARSPVAFGTSRYHLDRAAREAFGVGFDALERAWAAQVRREFG